MGKIYFGIFGVRLVFLFFLFLQVGIIFKKSQLNPGRIRPGLQPGRPLKPRPEPRLSPSRRRPETLAAAAARAAAAPHRPAARRRHPPEPLAAVTRTEVATVFSRKTVRFYFETEMHFYIY